MVSKKRPSVFYIIIALLMSGALFFSGIGLGLLINDFKAMSVSSGIQEAADSIKDTELELLLFEVMEGNLSCNYLISKSYELGGEAGDLGDKVEMFEDYNEINSDDYVDLKKEYMRVLIKDWLILEQIRQVCPSDYNIVLYFYKDSEDCPDCLNQGFILSYYKNILGNELMVFSLDSSLDMSIIRAIEANYGVSVYPSIVVNGEVYSGPTNAETLGEILRV